MTRLYLTVIFFITFIGVTLRVSAITVGTSQELMQAISAATGGDQIIVEPGNYSVNAEIRVSPLTIAAQSSEQKPVISISSGSAIFTVNAGPVTGIEIRDLIFEGGSQAITAIKSKATGVVIENCQFNNFEGVYGTTPIIHFAYDDQGRKDRMQLSRVSSCRFNRSSRSKGIYSFGPTIVEDCVFENIFLAMHLVDQSGLWSSPPRMDYANIVRRNEIYRTEGTTWDCKAITTQCTAPKIYENKIYDISVSGDGSAVSINGNGVANSQTLAEFYRNVIIDKWKAADSKLIHEGMEYGVEYAEPVADHGLVYENVLVGYQRPGLYNKGNGNSYFNNTSYFTNSDAYTFHCYGVGTDYKNNLQVGGRMVVQTAQVVATKVAQTYYPVGSDSDFPSMKYSCFWQLNESQSVYAEGPGFMRNDPKFVDPVNFDFHLRWDSPCINAGDGSRDGLTVNDIGAYEYPIQVSHFAVDTSGLATWQWHNGFQAVSQKVIVRWNASGYPVKCDDPADITVAEVSATATAAQTSAGSGYFSAFVQDVNGNWSAPTPDNVHRYYRGSSVDITSPSVPENNKIISVKFFPNPAGTTLAVSLEQGSGSQGTIELCTLQGTKIYQTPDEVSFPHQVNVSSYAPGVYLVKVVSGGKIFTQKVIIN